MGKDFDAALAELRGEPVTFKLGGTQFRVPTPVPSAPWVAMVSDPNRDTELAFHDYIREIIDPKQREAWGKAFRSSGIDAEGLTELVRYIIEEASGNPTKPRSSSRKSPRTNGARSKAVQSSSDIRAIS